MLLPILSAIWFGFRASRVGRSPIGWGMLGLLAFLVVKVVLTLMATAVARANPPSTQEEVVTLTIVLNVLAIAVLVACGFAIPPGSRSARAGEHDVPVPSPNPSPPDSRAVGRSTE